MDVRNSSSEASIFLKRKTATFVCVLEALISWLWDKRRGGTKGDNVFITRMLFLRIWWLRDSWLLQRPQIKTRLFSSCANRLIILPATPASLQYRMPALTALHRAVWEERACWERDRMSSWSSVLAADSSGILLRFSVLLCRRPFKCAERIFSGH